MSKFSGPTAHVRPPRGPTATTGPTVTYEGGAGFDLDAKSALYSLAVTNMVSETTFYEAAGSRDKRFADLVADVTRSDPAWVASMVPWLRNTANMRSASIVVACEYVKAGGPRGRQVINAACNRADEPAEIVGYWHAVHGRNIPKPVKRGVADAAARLYNDRAVLKYDGAARGIRMGDVIELTHPTPRDVSQSGLFRHLIDRRHNRPVDNVDVEVFSRLLAAAYRLDTMPVDERRPALRRLGPELLSDAGYTWERLSGWLPGGMDAEAWEAMIPSMGYMACLRNLRNFEQAGVSDTVLQQVAGRLSDPDEVARSRQFPYRIWSAYEATGTLTFGPALEKALNLSVANVPKLSGRTLVLVDTSGSMTWSHLSSNSKATPAKIAALFGCALTGAGDVDLVIYGTTSKLVQNPPRSVLRAIEHINAVNGSVGGSTNTWPAVARHYVGHDRVVILTDIQDHPSRAVGVVPPNVPVYVWDLQGHGRSNVDLSVPGRYLFSGFTDAAFRMIGLLEQGRDADWPWTSRPV